MPITRKLANQKVKVAGLANRRKVRAKPAKGRSVIPEHANPAKPENSRNETRMGSSYDENGAEIGIQKEYIIGSRPLLTLSQVNAIRMARAAGGKFEDIAKIMGLSKSFIWELSHDVFLSIHPEGAKKLADVARPSSLSTGATPLIERNEPTAQTSSGTQQAHPGEKPALRAGEVSVVPGDAEIIPTTNGQPASSRVSLNVLLDTESIGLLLGMMYSDGGRNVSAWVKDRLVKKMQYFDRTFEMVRGVTLEEKMNDARALIVRGFQAVRMEQEVRRQYERAAGLRR